jgi:hypothetical protein
MKSLNDYLLEYQAQLKKGIINKAYQGLMEYIMGLRVFLQGKYPTYFVSGSIYFGTMDMTYFSFYPESLKSRGLKVAIVFLHEKYCFEVWLAGTNKKVQKEFWELINKAGWNKYQLVPDLKGADSIIEYTLVDHPDFNNLDSLTNRIENETLKFIKDVEGFLISCKG